jgi:large subunit ribosomal protein L4
MRRLAVRSALSVKAAAEQIILLDTLRMEESRTKQMLALLDSLGIQDSALILLSRKDEAVERSARNVPEVKTLRANYLNIRDILGYDHLVLPLEALEVVEAIWG